MGLGGDTEVSEVQNWRERTDVELSLEDNGARLERLPLERNMIQLDSMDYKENFELLKGAKKLFNFDVKKLSPLQQMYIIGYAEKGTKLGACKKARVTYSVVSKWMENPDFVAALQEAVEMVKDVVEEELLQRAMTGSDKLLLEVAKAMSPETYNRRQADVNVKGTVMHTWADLAKQVTIDAEFEEDKKGG